MDALRVNKDGLISARDLGKALGFGSRGGNLTRNFRTKWADRFYLGCDYHRLKGGVIYNGPQTRGTEVWLTMVGLLKVLAEIRNNDDDPVRRTNAAYMLKDLRLTVAEKVELKGQVTPKTKKVQVIVTRERSISTTVEVTVPFTANNREMGEAGVAEAKKKSDWTLDGEDDYIYEIAEVT